jgi:hypothetical protein
MQARATTASSLRGSSSARTWSSVAAVARRTREGDFVGFEAVRVISLGSVAPAQPCSTFIPAGAVAGCSSRARARGRMA